METHNKILLAGELLVDAAKIYRSGRKNVDFAKSILLAGAVIGIVAPLLEERGTKSSQAQFAEWFIQVRRLNLSEKNEKKEISNSIRFDRFIYNSLKHSGSKHLGSYEEGIKPSDDLLFEADLKREACRLIESAIADYNHLDLSREIVNMKLSDDLLTLLQSRWTA